MAKYMFITGGVVSSLGKGITAAAIGSLLASRGLSIRIMKLDPYLNVDPGDMSPLQHGEVYVTDDGAETDLDLGHYERFIGRPTSRKSSHSAGRIYSDVLQKERQGEYQGTTVQMIPHVSSEIKSRIRAQDEPGVDIILCEIGGTVGDIEGLIFLEAIRELGLEEGRSNALYVHLTYVPYIKAAGEVKSKPSQQSVAKLREIGIMPDILICRSEVPIGEEVRKKLSLFCNVPLPCVIEEQDVQNSIYEIPLILNEQGLDDIILRRFQINKPPANLQPWRDLLESILHPMGKLRIGVVDKFGGVQDAYKSLFESLAHAAAAHKYKAEIIPIAAEDIEVGNLDALKQVDAILVPGGSGTPGVEGKIRAIQYARENKIPFFGICLGFQLATVEFARNVAGLSKAHSTEMNPETPHPVIHKIDVQAERPGAINSSGRRMGAWTYTLTEGSLATRAYGKPQVSERHRNRYQFNTQYGKPLAEAGLQLTGASGDGRLPGILELRDHPWFLAVQFHPEYKSQPLHPHPLFKDFIGAAIARIKNTSPSNH